MTPLTTIIQEALEVWLKCGYSYNDFWDYTFKDVNTVLDSYHFKIERENRRIYDQAYLTAVFIASGISGKPGPTFEEVYGAKEDETAYVDNAVLKELWLDYAETWNKKRKGGK